MIHASVIVYFTGLTVINVLMFQQLREIAITLLKICVILVNLKEKK